MPTIAEVRDKFPQYGDLNDEQLAKGLHAKYYSDVPFDVFSKQIGLSAKPAPDTAAAEPSSGMGRKLGLGARAAYEGVTMLPEMAENLGVGARNMIEQGVNRYAPGLGKAIYSANSKIAGVLPDGAAQNVVSSILPPGPGAPYDSASQVNRESITDLGAPEPQTSGEHYMSAGIRGATGALAGGAGLGNMASLGGMARTAIPGVTGGLSAEAARQGGAGPAGQMVAGLAGGFAPASVEELTRLAGTTAANIARPMLRSGQEQMAGSVLARQATNPQAAATKLESAQPVIPSSARTAGEASQDIGLLSLEKGLRARNPGAFGTRVSEQNAARQAELGNLAGTEADISAAKLARDATTGPMREQALTAANETTNKIQSLTGEIENRFRSKASALQDKGRFDTQQSQMQAVASKPYLAVAGMPRVSGRFSPHADRAEEAVSAAAEMPPIIAQRQAELAAAQSELAQLKSSGASALEIGKVTRRIDGIMATPGMRASQVVEKSMVSIKDRLNAIAKEDGSIDARDLYTVRKELGNYVQQAAKDSSSWDKKLTQGLQIELQHSIDDAIEQSAPGFKAYLERYKEMSKPIDQMKILQEIQRRSQLSSADITTGQEFLGAGKFDAAMKQALQKNGAKLTDDQIQRLKAIRTDLQYGQAINSPLVKAPGSDTFQNLSIAQVIGAGATSAHPALRMLTKPLDWVYKIGGTDEAVSQILADAMLDPKLAAAMLRRATPASVQSFSGALRVRAVQNAVGTAAGLGSSLQAPSVGRNMSQAPQ